MAEAAQAGKTALEVDADQVEPVTVQRMSYKCLICRAKIECPADEDQWGWLKGETVEAFKKAHDHGNARAVGAEIETFEVE